MMGLNYAAINSQRRKIASKVKDCCGATPDVLFSDGINGEVVNGEYIDPMSNSTGPSIYSEYGGELKWIIQCNECGRWVLSFKKFTYRKKLKDAIKDWNSGKDYWHGCQD